MCPAYYPATVLQCQKKNIKSEGQHHGSIRPTLPSVLCTRYNKNFRHLSINNSAFEGTLKFSTIHQRTEKESHPSVHQIAGRQSMGPAVSSAVACEPAPAQLGHSLGIPRIHCLRQLPVDNRTFGRAWVYRGKKVSVHHWRTKYVYKSEHTSVGERNCLTLPTLLPNAGTV